MRRVADTIARRLPMLLAALALLAGLWAGLLRMGWPWPPVVAALPAWHGPLMAAGFFGTLIGVERAAALALQPRLAGRAVLLYAGPLASGLGALALIAGLPPAAGAVPMLLGGAHLAATTGLMARQQPSGFTLTLLLGAVAWLAGTAGWALGGAIPAAVPWWMAFLVLTVAGERLELGRIRRRPAWAEPACLVLVGAVAAATAVAVRDVATATWAAGGAGLGVALWLLRFDVARATLRQPGWTGFAAAGMLAGYAWLALGGALALAAPDPAAGMLYDARLHAVFVGFALSVTFAHAPLVLPAVVGRSFAYHRAFYAPLGLLHGALALRIVGDLAGSVPARQWGGLLGAVAIVLFFALAAGRMRA